MDPLQAAIRRQDLDDVERLISGGEEVHRRSALLLGDAATYGTPDITRTLIAAGADVNAKNSSALSSAAYRNREEIIDLLLGAGARSELDDALVHACRGGWLAAVRPLLKAGANIHHLEDRPVYTAYTSGYWWVAEELLLAGADADAIPWGDRPGDDDRLVVCVRRADFLRLPDYIQLRWLRLNLRPRLRLSRALERARARLDRPPTEPLNKSEPTREELIAHLQTAGRRFAREYWEEGIELFFPTLDLGPVPDEFVFK